MSVSGARFNQRMFGGLRCDPRRCSAAKTLVAAPHGTNLPRSPFWGSRFFATSTPLPAYPMDGGCLLRSLPVGRLDYYPAVASA
jgi:hypothetical protein